MRGRYRARLKSEGEPPAPPFSFMNKRHRRLSDKMRTLISAGLADKIGYLHINNFPKPQIFNSLPTRTFGPHKVIQSLDELFIVQQGLVEIWHKRHDLFIKTLLEGSLFGDSSLLGQTMLMTQAITGMEGATVAVLDKGRVRWLIQEYPLVVSELLGPRLKTLERRHFSCQFQITASKVAGLLLELAGSKGYVEKLSHSDLSKMIGVYRETTTNVIQDLKAEKLIQVQRRRIVILDKPALKELSEL